ncbi:hypothetical protein [Campylobacter hyointestinalis]|uniref:hypothetical protein n=1 Tax=Campylobacter hyointestinalis TaxID=198 RepID=UPI000DCF1867|nr:hypothetical protein [Campylobacter hyointestinalis]RAZ49184.1 hypothetical protein CHL9004_07830 [Campylobacter hyointestinalis subsp. lawsonii]
MGYPSFDELRKSFKAEERRAIEKRSKSPLRPCDPKYQPTMDKHCKKLHDYFYPQVEPPQKYFKRKDTQVRIRLNILKRHCKELTALADELENKMKVGEPFHIKETATKIISYIKEH